MRTRNCQRGSIELVALGFCAALVVLLAIPLIEEIVASTKQTEKTSVPAAPQVLVAPGGPEQN